MRKELLVKHFNWLLSGIIRRPLFLVLCYLNVSAGVDQHGKRCRFAFVCCLCFLPFTEDQIKIFFIHSASDRSLSLEEPLHFSISDLSIEIELPRLGHFVLQWSNLFVKFKALTNG